MVFSQGVINAGHAPTIQSGPQTERPLASVGIPDSIFLNQTAFAVEQLIGGVWVQIATGPNPGSILQGGNSFGVPVAIGSNDNQSVIFRTNGVPRMTLTVGAGVNSIEGSLTSTGNLNSTLPFQTANPQSSIFVGVSNGSYVVGTPAQVKFGVANGISGQRQTIQIGVSNTMTSSDEKCLMMGVDQLMDFAAATVSTGAFVIGRLNQMRHQFCGLIGLNNQTSANNQLMISQNPTNTDGAGFNDVYFGVGRQSQGTSLIAFDVTINGSGGGNAADKVGGALRLAAGKSTGAAVSPDLVFATAVTGAAGSTLQALQDVGRFKGNTGKFEVIDSIKTGSPGAGLAGEWRLGNVRTAATVLDATQYVEVMIAGVVRKLCLAT